MSYFDAKTLEQLSASKPDPTQMSYLEQFCELCADLALDRKAKKDIAVFIEKVMPLITPDILTFEYSKDIIVRNVMLDQMTNFFSFRKEKVITNLITLHYPLIKQLLLIHRNYGLNEATQSSLLDTYAQLLLTYMINSISASKTLGAEAYENRTYYRLDFLRRGRSAFGSASKVYDEIIISLFQKEARYIDQIFNWILLITRFILSASLSTIYHSTAFLKQTELNIEVNSFLNRIQEVIITNNLNVSRDHCFALISYFLEKDWKIEDMQLSIMNRETGLLDSLDLKSATTRETNYGNSVLNRKIFWKNSKGDNIFRESISVYPITQLSIRKRDLYEGNFPKFYLKKFRDTIKSSFIESMIWKDGYFEINFATTFKEEPAEYFRRSFINKPDKPFRGYVHDIWWREYMFSEITTVSPNKLHVRFRPFADVLNYQFATKSLKDHQLLDYDSTAEKIFRVDEDVNAVLQNFRLTDKVLGILGNFCILVPQLRPLFYDKSDKESPQPLTKYHIVKREKGYSLHLRKYVFVRASETADSLMFRFTNESDILNTLARRVRDEFLQAAGLLAKLRPQKFAEEYDGTRGTLDMGKSIANSIRAGKRMAIQTFKKSKKEEPAYVFVAMDTTKSFPATAVPYSFFLINVFISLFEGRLKKLIYGSIGTWSVFPHDDIETYLIRNITGDVSGFDYIAQRLIPTGYPVKASEVTGSSEEREWRLAAASGFRQKESWAKEAWSKFKYSILVDNWSDSMKNWERFEKIPPEYLYHVALDFCRDRYRSFFSYNLALDFLDNMEIMRQCLDLVEQIKKATKDYDKSRVSDPFSESTRAKYNDLLSLRDKFARAIVYRKHGKPKRFNQNKYHKEYSYINPSNDLCEIYNTYSGSRFGEAHMLEDLCVHPYLYLKGLKYYLIMSALKLTEGYGERFYNRESHQWESIGAIASFVYWLETVAQRSDVRLIFIWVMDEAWEKKILGSVAGENQTVSRSSIAQRYLEMDEKMNEKRYTFVCPDPEEYEIKRDATVSSRTVSYNDWVKLLTIAMRYGDITEGEKSLVRMVIDGSNFPFLEVGLKHPLTKAKDVGVPEKEFDPVFNQEFKDGKWILTEELRDPLNFVSDSLWNLSWYNPWSKTFELFPNCYENMKIRTFYRFFGWILHNWEKVYITKPNRLVEISDIKGMLNKIKDQKFIV